MAAPLGTWDYVIVGAGTAGCVLANRLSADPDVRVLLLEAGGKDDWIWIHIPVGYLYCIGNPRTDWCYRTEPDPGLNGRSILYARGKVLGGCSSINAMLYLRGQRRDYDEWAPAGDGAWSWSSVLPMFKRSRTTTAARATCTRPAASGGSSGSGCRGTMLDAFREAMAQVGMPKVEDFNGGDNEGAAFFEVNQRRGVRWSAAKGFLTPAMDRPNLTVMTDVHVNRIRLEGKRAAGVELRHGGEDAFVEARIETILAAGAIGSPQILQLSGIGPGALLQEHGIPAAHELRGVGENLQDHLQLRMAFKVKNAVTMNQRANSLWGKAAWDSSTRCGAPARSRWRRASSAASRRATRRSRPRTSSTTSSRCRSTSSATRCIRSRRSPPRCATCGRRAAATCASRALIRAQHPAINPRYLSTPEDRKVAADALRLTRKIASQPALARYEPQEFKPGVEFRTDDELAQAAGDVGTTIFHPVGTCKMSPASDPAAVVDSRLRVHGIDALRVVDASIMPTITSGNTNSPTVMIAERGAEMTRADRQSRR